MTLRVIYLTDADGSEHAYMFLVLDAGVEIEYTADDLIPLFDSATDTAWVN